MDKALQLKNVMTPVPYRVSPEDPLKNAKQQMAEHNVRHLPVCSGDKIEGMVSERDVGLIVSLAKHVTDEEALLVRDVMSVAPYIVDASERLDKVLLYMGSQRIGSALITENDELIGIVTTTDVCRVCGQFLQEFFDAQS